MNRPTPTVTSTAHRQRQIHAEAVRRIYEMSIYTEPLMPLFMVMLVFTLWQHLDHAWLLVWLFAISAVYGWRVVLALRYRAAPPAVEEAPLWDRRIAATFPMEGVLLGLAGMFFVVPDSVISQVILLTIIVGIPAGSLFAASWLKNLTISGAIPSVGLTALGMFWRNDSGEAIFGIGLTVYLAMLFFMSRVSHKASMETITLRFENLDLVEQLRAQKDVAEKANIAKSKFLAAASHDLRQPLHALGLFVTSLSERIHYPEVRDIVENIHRCVGALNGLFEALLDISRLDAGVVEPKPVHFMLGSVLERLAPEYEPQARAKGLVFSMQGCDLALYSDPGLVERIARNLIGNAIRYTAHGKIHVEARQLGEQVELAVHDTGPGIPPEKREEIFQEFIQLSNPERDRTQGLGLGLAIVRRLATLLGGTVTVDAAVGGGSVFRVALPRGDAAAVAVVTSDELSNLTAKPFEGRLVIVIDDERAVRDAVQSLLDGWGCTTVTAEDATSALQALRDLGRVPDVIMADYRLREEATGAQAIEQLHAEFGRPIPAFIVTGDTAPERLQEARASGHLLLHKPVQPGKLRVVLARLLRAPSSR